MILGQIRSCSYFEEKNYTSVTLLCACAGMRWLLCWVQTLVSALVSCSTLRILFWKLASSHLVSCTCYLIPKHTHASQVLNLSMAFVNRQCSLQFVSLLSSTSFFKSGTDLFKGGKCAVIIAKQRSTRAFSDVISVYKYCEPLCVRSSQTVKYRFREIIKYHRSVRTRRKARRLKCTLVHFILI